jgi:hypothetical protein
MKKYLFIPSLILNIFDLIRDDGTSQIIQKYSFSQDELKSEYQAIQTSGVVLYDP